MFLTIVIFNAGIDIDFWHEFSVCTLSGEATLWSLIESVDTNQIYFETNS